MSGIFSIDWPHRPALCGGRPGFVWYRHRSQTGAKRRGNHHLCRDTLSSVDSDEETGRERTADVLKSLSKPAVPMAHAHTLERRHRSFRALRPAKPGFEDVRPANEVFQLAVGGHRGNGANAWTSEGPSEEMFLHRENTIKSMLAAVENGASFLEFDVQVTRDGVCVIYHDNYVVVGDELNPTSHLIADMEVEAFKGASPVNSVVAGGSDLEGASDDEVVSSFQPHPMLTREYGIERRRMESSSDVLAGTSPESSVSNPSSKLLRQHRNGVIASSSEKSLHAWTVVDDEEFPTLLEVFERMPPNVAFDIEIKMATGDGVVRTPEEELRRMTDAILATVAVAEDRARALGHPPRPLLFSSFDPDICVDVKRRRPDDWVMFLSTGGTSYHADPRRMSIDAAIEVAALNGLEGVILDSGSLFRDQGAVERARGEGLLTMTYGVENDDVDWVRDQKTLGVHGVIVDDTAKMKAAFLL